MKAINKWRLGYILNKVNKLLFIIMLIATIKVSAQENVLIINMAPMNVIYLTDTAKTDQDISVTMQKSFGNLFNLVGQLNLKPGRVMSIYHTMNAPWIYDVAVEIEGSPDLPAGNAQIKTIPGGEAILLHFKGPYEQLGNAYLKIENWLKENNKQRAGPPIEVYLNAPSTVKDKNDLLTDIYQLIK